MDERCCSTSSGTRTRGVAADALVAAGIVAAVPTARSGLSDWADVRGGSRRVGTVHAPGNSTGLSLHILRASPPARRPSLLRQGFGVNQTAFDSAPEEWTAVLDADQLHDETLTAAATGTTPVLLLRRGDRVHALDDRCFHRG